jgi:hypothetical protein
MLITRAYYECKHFIPRRLRLMLRRLHAKKVLGGVREQWPIDPVAGAAPEGWVGWPEGKRFAFVLTHDVEGPRGVSKCHELMRMEMDLGFRSCFNFIPEGSYRLPPPLREELIANGFEVGVHDLHHDGHLYRSRAGFSRKAKRINRYLRDWNASGFRGGFMFHNLDWLHDIEMEYDSSIFDTDPFEPQSDGCRSIFPFRVPQNGGGTNDRDNRTHGYVELPYTLPQDSTLFLILRESTPAIWIQKLEWIASRRGMALLNAHPDYMHFGEERATYNTYASSYYRDFLLHVKTRFGDEFWHALPKDVARFVSNGTPPSTSPTGFHS